jgi:hypothetical protein
MKINSFISWVGGKKELRNIIYRLFPKDFGRYIEVFGGGGWVLFGRPPDCKRMEVYNDFNGNLTNLFCCVKNRTLAFSKQLGFLPLNSRHEFHVLRRFFEKGEFDTEYLQEELELAQQNLPPPEFEELRLSCWCRPSQAMCGGLPPFSSSSATATAADVPPTAASPLTSVRCSL